jgi:hypothetical protein
VLQRKHILLVLGFIRSLLDESDTGSMSDTTRKQTMQFTLAHLMWAMVVVAALFAILAADRKWGPRSYRVPELISRNTRAPFLYEFALGHPDEDLSGFCYVGSVLFEPKSWQRSRADRGASLWRPQESGNVPVVSTMWFGQFQAATPQLPFGYRYLRWETAEGAQILHLYVLDQQTVNLPFTGQTTYERSEVVVHLVQAYEDSGWTVLSVADDLRKSQEDGRATGGS